MDIEDFVHVAVYRDIGIQEYTCLVGGQLEGSKFGPCIFEAGGDESCLSAGEQWLDGMDN